MLCKEIVYMTSKRWYLALSLGTTGNGSWREGSDEHQKRVELANHSTSGKDHAPTRPGICARGGVGCPVRRSPGSLRQGLLLLAPGGDHPCGRHGHLG